MPRFYDKRAWRDRARKTALIKAHWTCSHCGAPIRGRAAHVHHVYPVKTAPSLRLEPRNHRALCETCHCIEEHARDKGCDINGLPHSPLHPWNVLRRNIKEQLTGVA